jgi:hypothetical protein
MLQTDELAQHVKADIDPVVHEILRVLSACLRPPNNLREGYQDELKVILEEAVELSHKMRTQWADHIILAPFRPEYDENGDLVQKIYFSAGVMNHACIGPKRSNKELERQKAIVSMVLFPLVVKKGNDNGSGQHVEVVIFPAKVLVGSRSKGGP